MKFSLTWKVKNACKLPHTLPIIVFPTESRHLLVCCHQLWNDFKWGKYMKLALLLSRNAMQLKPQAWLFYFKFENDNSKRPCYDCKTLTDLFVFIIFTVDFLFTPFLLKHLTSSSLTLYQVSFLKKETF